MSTREPRPVACINHLRFNTDGLIPAITQDWLDGAVLMLAWMNRPSMVATFKTGQVHYWSRSRQELWHKGATSGHIQLLRGFRYDCDADALLLSVEQVGDVACHTGARGCFYETGANPTGGGPAALAPPADALSERAQQRLLVQPINPVQEPMAKLRQASEALTRQWQQPPGTDDVVCALTLLDALQDGLSARGIPWREVLRQARRSQLR
ncbi:MAG: phosphoribosyl-AMP cyclohydrolase [Cyanobacteria bacterium]|nr:phosphoribosyl-AMP cyclohydrolase [Cyanobacteria bacterium bin.51]